MWMKLLVEDCWSSFCIVFMYVRMISLWFSLVMLSHCCKHYVIGHVIGHVSRESHVYRERERERERETERETEREQPCVGSRSFVDISVCHWSCMSQ